MFDSKKFSAASDAKKALRKLSSALLLTLSIGIAMPGMISASANAALLDQAPLTFSGKSAYTGNFPTDVALQLTIAGGSGGGAVTFSDSGGGGGSCMLVGSVLTQSEEGSPCVITATKSGNGIYNDSSVTKSFNFMAGAVVPDLPAQVSQEPLVITSIQGKVNSMITLTTSGGSGTGALTYSVSNGTASSCVISEGVLTAQASGTCLVTATKAEDSDYFEASSIETVVSFDSSNQDVKKDKKDKK
jgi:hypothetical protein